MELREDLGRPIDGRQEWHAARVGGSDGSPARVLVWRQEGEDPPRSRSIESGRVRRWE